MNEVTTVTQPAAETAPAPQANLSLDSALERLKEQRGEQARPAERKSPPVRQLAPSPEPIDGAKWTDDEARYIAVYHFEAKRFHDDVAKFVRANQVDLNALEKTDKGRAAAIRVELDQAERELRQRYEVLARSKAAIEAKEQERIAGRALQQINTQRAILSERLPNLDKPALRGYLSRVGFSDEEISQAIDARVVELAEKARRYDDGITNSKPPPIPPVRRAKPAPLSTRLDDARSRLERTGSIDDAIELLYAQRRQRGKR